MTKEEAIEVFKNDIEICTIQQKQACDMAIKALEPQRKRGKWIEVDICNCHATLKCSVCDRVIEPTFIFGEYSYEDIKEWYPFCHCGADMRGNMDDE